MLCLCPLCPLQSWHTYVPQYYYPLQVFPGCEGQSGMVYRGWRGDLLSRHFHRHHMVDEHPARPRLYNTWRVWAAERQSEAMFGARKKTGGKRDSPGETWWHQALIFFMHFLAQRIGYAPAEMNRISSRGPQWAHSWDCLYIYIYNGKCRHFKVALQRLVRLDYKNEHVTSSIRNGVMCQWVKVIKFCPQHKFDPFSLTRLCDVFVHIIHRQKPAS